MIRDRGFFRVQWPSTCRSDGEFGAKGSGCGGDVRPYEEHMGKRA